MVSCRSLLRSRPRSVAAAHLTGVTLLTKADQVPLQIQIAESAAVPYVLHRGGVIEGMAVRATPRFGPPDYEPRFSNIAVRRVLSAGCGHTGEVHVSLCILLAAQCKSTKVLPWHDGKSGACRALAAAAVCRSVMPVSATHSRFGETAQGR